MRIQFWGTAAAEGIPGVFCNCDACKEARERKGRFIRTRSQVLINDDLLIDFGPDTFMHSLKYDFDLSTLAHVLVTHVHQDHYYPDEIYSRLEPYAHDMPAETLTFHGSEDLITALTARTEHPQGFANQRRVMFDIMRPYETSCILSYEITPLPARHGTAHPFVYLICQGEKAFLLLNDTGRLLPEVYEWLAKKKVHIDLISFDCTYGFANTFERYGKAINHMGMLDNFAVREALSLGGNADENTLCIANHFSHNGTDVGYELMLAHAKDYGFDISYDGMVVEI